MKPASEEAYRLLQDGVIALAQVESAGMAVDVSYVESAMRRTKKRAERILEKLQDSEVVKIWKQMFGGSTNFTSDTQLAKVLFDRMGFKPPRETEGGRQSTDEEALSTIDHPFIAPYVRFKKLSKAGGTFLKSIRREVVDGFIHCFFDLHTTVSFRSSSRDTNFQNFPVRDPEISEIIRQSFIPRPGRIIVEVDIAGAEVRVAAAYHKDPTMIDYILDKSKDMHRDVAMEAYMLPKEEITKALRHTGKNQFVFPQFYGDWYKDCAEAMWGSIEKLNLTTASGKPLKEHLASKGITQRGACDPEGETTKGTFEDHIRKIEHSFWNDRFPVYSQWKKDWYEAYRKDGYFRTLTGFVCQGMMKKNQVINYPVQGSAFHLLLWSLIRLVNKEIPKRKMQSLCIGQIHDSAIFDAVPSELPELLHLVNDVMTKKINRFAPWMVVPVEVEFEVCSVDGSWATKKPWCLECMTYAKECAHSKAT